MDKFDIDDAHHVTISRDEARSFFDGEDLPEEFETALDQAQGEADQPGKVGYVLIKITA